MHTLPQIDPRAPLESTFAEFPNFAASNVKEIHLGAGDVLYLPSLWMHAASQTTEIVALNVWYDMTFGDRWGLVEFVKEVLVGE